MAPGFCAGIVVAPPADFNARTIKVPRTVLPLPGGKDFLVTDVGRPVGVAVLDEIRRGSACSARVSVWIHRGDRRRGVGTAAVERGMPGL